VPSRSLGEGWRSTRIYYRTRLFYVQDLASERAPGRGRVQVQVRFLRSGSSTSTPSVIASEAWQSHRSLTSPENCQPEPTAWERHSRLRSGIHSQLPDRCLVFELKRRVADSQLSVTTGELISGRRSPSDPRNPVALACPS
jgi:hypothetical protein